MISLTRDETAIAPTLADAPISTAAIDELLNVRPELTVDGLRPSASELASRLSEFWLPDEVILYIGLAGPRKRSRVQGEVATRVREFYSTRLGARSPHAGGWPLKTLSCLHDLFVHYAYCDNEDAAEAACLERFRNGISEKSRNRLKDDERMMPFANLEFPKGQRKRLGIAGAKAPR